MAKYTAKEMREVADNLDSIYVAPECEDKKEQYGYLSIASMMLSQAADAIEREKRYEYAARSNYDGFVDPEHCDESELSANFSCLKCDEYTVVRREVGEWEEVQNDNN